MTSSFSTFGVSYRYIILINVAIMLKMTYKKIAADQSKCFICGYFFMQEWLN